MPIIPARAGFTVAEAWETASFPDHPRSRGVYGVEALHHRRWPRSSPLARGLLVPGQEGDRRRAIIPARAGFTQASSRTPTPPSDHPRSRGVYVQYEIGTIPAGRSSPLARGLQRARMDARQGEAIIPARAGFTAISTLKAHNYDDHPRSRGVYCTGRSWMRPAARSSPLARGLREDDVVDGVADAIIPARAGFTPSPRRAGRRLGDHPRSRGVYLDGGGNPVNETRSSPLARGLPEPYYSPHRRQTIIPARAGFTGGGRARRPTRPDHPRSRGVYETQGLRERNRQRSSPLARGLPFLCCVRIQFRSDHPRSRGVYSDERTRGLYDERSSPLARGLPRNRARRPPGGPIIPARAGFTRSTNIRRRGMSDHPRSRGVYEMARPTVGPFPRSSPLARGLHGLTFLLSCVTPIIPARAGFTGELAGGTD